MPMPSGLTVPAATTATRLFVTSVASNVMKSGRFSVRGFLLLSQSKHLTNDPETENESLEVGRLSVEFIQWRFEIRLAGTVAEQRF